MTVSDADDPAAAKRARLARNSAWRLGGTVVVKKLYRVVGAAGLEMPLEPHLIQAWCGRSMSTVDHCHGHR
jgi:hypothetical protein